MGNFESFRQLRIEHPEVSTTIWQYIRLGYGVDEVVSLLVSDPETTVNETTLRSATEYMVWLNGENV